MKKINVWLTKMKNINRAGFLLVILTAFSFLTSCTDSTYYHSSRKNYTGDSALLHHFLQEKNISPSFLPGDIMEIPFIGSEPQHGSIYLLFPEEYASSALPLLEGAWTLEKRGALYHSLKFLILPGEFAGTNRNDRLIFPDPGQGPGPDGTGFTPSSSAEFLQTFYPPEPVSFIYMNTAPEEAGLQGEKLQITAAGSGSPSPSWLLSRLVKALGSAGLEYEYLHLETSLSKLNLRDYPSPLDPFLDAGYPAIEIRGASWSPPDLETSQKLLQSLSGMPPLPEYRDRHYQVLPLPDSILLVQENHYLLTLLFLFAAMMAYPVFAKNRLKKYLKTLWRHLWSLPLLVLLLFLFLFAATMLLNYLGEIKGIDRLWEYYPGTMLVLKIAAAAFLFILVQRLFLLLPFSRRGSFYSASALFFFIVDMAVLSIIDLDLTYYLLVPFLSVFLFTILGNRIGKMLFFILAGAPFMLALYGFFSLPAYEVIRSILLSPIKGNIIIALHLLPFLLMLIRLQYLFHHPNIKITLITTLGLEFILLAVAVVSGIVLLQSQPFLERPQPLVLLDESSDTSEMRRVSLYSTARLGPLPTDNLALVEGSFEGNRATLLVPGGEDPLDVQLDVRSFLARKQYTLRISTPHPLALLRVEIRGEESISLLDASEDWKNIPDGGYAIVLDRKPESPVTMSFTLPETAKGELLLEARFLEPPYPLDLQGSEKRFSIIRKAVHRSSLELE